MAAKTWSAAADGNWSAGGNWNGGTVPATTDTITFNGTSTKNCTIDALGTWSGGTVTITSAYSGTITQSVTMTCGNFSIAGGTWTSGSQTWSSTSTGTFSQTGGAFTATSGTMTVAGNVTITSGTFTHNSGTFKLTVGVSTQTVNASAATFNLVTIAGGANNLTVSNGTTLPLGASPLSTLSGGGGVFTINGTITIASGTWDCKTSSSVISIVVNSGGSVSGITDLNIGGSITVNSGATWPSNVTLTLRATLATQILDLNGITLGTCTISGGSNNITINSGTTVPLGADPTSTLTGILTVNGAISFTGGSGAWVLSSTFTGLVIGSTGTVTNLTSLQIGCNLTVVAGATLPSGVALTIKVQQGTQTITVPSANFTLGTCTLAPGSNNLTIASGTTIPLGSNPVAAWAGANQTLTVNGTLDFSGTLDLSTGAADVTIVFGASASVTNGSTLRFGGALTVDTGTTFPSSFGWTFSPASTTARTWAMAGKTYGNFYRTTSKTTQLTITGSNTFADFKDNDGLVAHTILFTSGTTQTVTTWTVSGVSGKLVTINAVTAGSSFTLTSPTNKNMCGNWISAKDIAATGSGTPATRWYFANSTNTSGNSGITFGACVANCANKYTGGFINQRRACRMGG